MIEFLRIKIFTFHQIASIALPDGERPVRLTVCVKQTTRALIYKSCQETCVWQLQSNYHLSHITNPR